MIVAHIYIDYQTIGCQDRHQDILHINYKAEGDGFQRNTIFRYMYTNSFYFQNQAPPNMFFDMKMSPLHARIRALQQKLPL